jgi:hypothetical protein
VRVGLPVRNHGRDVTRQYAGLGEVGSVHGGTVGSVPAARSAGPATDAMMRVCPR